ncbi:MAG: DUF2937 family protein, partial [Pseudomonadota bacterium]
MVDAARSRWSHHEKTDEGLTMGRFFATILAIAAGLAGSQAPGFTLQYMQNLTGRVDELRPTVEQFDANVGQYGYTRARAMEECGNADG